MPPKVAAPLLANEDVRRWHANLAQGSRASADINLRRLDAFCKWAKTSPADLASMSEKALHEKFLDFVGAEEARGVAGSYIGRTLVATRSWLAHNGVKLSRAVKIRGLRDSPTLRDEQVPTQEDLRKVILAGTLRIRTACSLVAFAGLRPEVLGNYLGDDGLVLSDFPELKIGKDSVEFTSIPTVVRVRPGLSKNSNGYLSFLSAEGCDYLKQYLEERLRAGEKLRPDTDLIHPDRAEKRFIRTINIGDAIRTAIRGAGFRWRPYNLRHFFDTQLLMAESKGKVAHDFRVYWMGHVGSIDARYTTNKRQVPKEFLEEMRAAYKRCEPFLSTNASTANPERDLTTRRVVLRMHGYTEEELAKIDISTKTDDELIALADAKRAENQRAARSALPRTGQRVANLADVERLIGEGWEFVAPLGSDRVILRSLMEAAGVARSG
jgi:site-specific recombinase XerD